MTTQVNPQVVEGRWARLRDALQERFELWDLPAADHRATEIVRDLRRSGWRVPLTDYAVRAEQWGGGRKLDPARIRQHADACRAALRGGPDDRDNEM